MPARRYDGSLSLSQNVNTCPVDRSVFRLILVRQGDKMVRQISVGSPEKEEEGEEEDLTYCEVCGNCDREDRLLLCDACDLGYHCECLTPPLDTVPVEEWYCPDCAPDHSQGEGRVPRPGPAGPVWGCGRGGNLLLFRGRFSILFFRCLALVGCRTFLAATTRHGERYRPPRRTM